jgi:hypothetical protein
MHQELAYGALDPHAVYGLIEMCAKEMPKVWRGNPFYLPAFDTLQQFLAKRLKIAWTKVSPDSDFTQIYFNSTTHSSDTSFSMLGMHALCFSQKLLDSDSGVYRDLRGMVDKDQAKKLLDEFIAEVSSEQVHDDAIENMQQLRTNPAFCFSILKAVGNTNFWDKSDSYVAPVAVVAAPCGLCVRDPLAEYKAKFDYPSTPRNADGTLKYAPSDVHSDTLNSNLELLRICWGTLGGEKVELPYAFRAVNEESKLIVNLTEIPPGMHTMGVGPLPKASIGTGTTDAADRGVACINANVAFQFSPISTAYQVEQKQNGDGVPAVEVMSFPDMAVFVDKEKYVQTCSEADAAPVLPPI